MKTVALCLIALLCVVILFGCDADRLFPKSQQDATVTEEEAKQAALEHAGFTEDEVSYLHVSWDDDGHYDVEFRQDRYEYEYEVHGDTGEILNFEKDFDD